MSSLYIVATPIGNLSDITKRAIDTLRSVDLILCEDTRVTKVLLEHYGIKTQLLSYHQHSRLEKTDYIIDFLAKGKNLALVSDAGTPGISDPGNKLVEDVVEKLGDRVKIVPIPGASAALAAASVSGFATDRFLFLGFVPQKKKRKQFFEEIATARYPVVFYESPYRIIKSLNELNLLHVKYDMQDAKIVVCRELTKKFETIYRGTIKEVIKRLENPLSSEKIKGEFVVIVEGKR